MSNFEFNHEEEDGDDDEFYGKDGMWNGRDVSIFLIDCSPKMFEVSGEEEEAHFIKAMRCAHSTASRKIIGNDQDFYGIVLFNTTKEKNRLDFSNIYVLQDIDRPGAERMLEMEHLLEDSSGQIAKNKFGSCSSASIHDVLWVCQNLFIACKKNLLTKNVLLFTCEDDPHTDDDHKRKQAMKKAKDLREGSVELEILPLGNYFNAHKFYKELLNQGDEDEDASLSVLANPAERFEELLERVRRLEHKQRSTGRVSFSIAPGCDMGVKVFTTIRNITKTKLKLYKVTNEEISSEYKSILEGTAELLLRSDFVKYKEYGGKKLKFSSDEVRSLSKVFEPGIELLGFKPLSSFKPDMYIKPGNFLYPDESSVKGSTKLFACLLERCLARGVCPVVRIVTREGGAVSWGFLLPQKEEKDEGGCQEKPPGFHVCYLPFADDHRSINLQNRPRANEDQVDSAKNIMKKLHFKYHPECFENPELQTHWRNLEALALNRHHLEPVKDYTVPDYERIRKKAGNLIEEFKSLVLPESYDPDVMSKKRPAAKPSSGAAKKPRVEAAPVSVEEMARQRKVNKLTVDALKEWLGEKGIRVSGKKKAQLVQDVYDNMGIDA